MKRIALLLISNVILSLSLSAQFGYSPFLDSIIQQADHNSVLLLTRQLAGDTTVTINGDVVTINSRHYLSAGNTRATDFLYQKFQEYGYTPEIHTFNGTRGKNVLAKKTGTKYPQKEFIICGHYDNMPSGNNSPGADDNASGTVAVLEAARLFANLDFDYSIRFAAWDEEEIGLVGSAAYAQYASFQGRQILGVLNLDMIAWDSDNDFVYTIATNTLSQSFSNDFLSTTALYQPQMNHNYYYTTASDHASFWSYGYPAMLVIEDWYDFNDYYHTPSDEIDILNMDYYVAMLRAALANIAAQAWDHRIGMEHNPVVSGNSTEPREAVLTVYSSHPINNNNFPPHLYYSVNNSEFEFVLPETAVDNVYTFLIPGFPMETNVQYYFAVQDSAGRLMATLPAGGKGINPPGTEVPEFFFNYDIGNIFAVSECSQTTPLPIIDFQNTYDNIQISGPGEIMDLNVNLNITHTRTGDLRIILTGPDGTISMLSDKNGGSGDNYTNTTFDDEAEQSITQGVAPFTGRFRPQMPLSAFNNRPIAGNWQLRVNDGGAGNTGTLDSWCLHFLFLDETVSVSGPDEEANVIMLQNYPNPTSDYTNIRFGLNQPSHVTLEIYNQVGQQVAELVNGKFDQGSHLIVAGLKHLAPGRYFYRLVTEKSIQTKPLVIIR
ncbi:MAG: M20/M25/M40 family metallo-hydrolase [Lentimicrobium sp.]|nr:M20/M25/M40 family metallo-hydrolase [Lentimicrobium sp.]